MLAICLLHFVSHYIFLGVIRVRIKCIAIAKSSLFFLYRNAKEIPFYYFRNTKLCKTRKNTCEFHLYCWDHVCKVNEWCLLHCFHHKFMVSTKIKVHDYCSTKCKKFSTCGRFWMARLKIFTLSRTLVIKDRRRHLRFFKNIITLKQKTTFPIDTIKLCFTC